MIGTIIQGVRSIIYTGKDFLIGRCYKIWGGGALNSCNFFNRQH